MFSLFKAKYGIALASSGAVSFGAYSLSNDEGSKRSAKFWINVLPMYCTYRFVQFLNQDLKVINDDGAMKLYDQLHERYTDRVKEITYDLKGFYLKQVSVYMLLLTLWTFHFSNFLTPCIII